jgi:hypothetical protein
VIKDSRMISEGATKKEMGGEGSSEIGAGLQLLRGTLSCVRVKVGHGDTQDDSGQLKDGAAKSRKGDVVSFVLEGRRVESEIEHWLLYVHLCIIAAFIARFHHRYSAWFGTETCGSSLGANFRS